MTVHSGATWAVLVASKPMGQAKRISDHSDGEVEHLIERARSVASSPNTICAVIAEELAEDWSGLASRIPRQNLYAQRRGETAQSAVARGLSQVSQRDTEANLVLIPSDHCAAEANAWVACAKNAIRLGVTHARTVIVLHDNPDNDPRSSRHYPGICSSSVMIGSIRSLLELCQGSRALSVIDMGLEDAFAPREAIVLTRVPPLNVVHITSVEEYAKLQRGEYGRSRSQLDVHA